MRLINTGDSTLTIECPEYSQAMHSTSGAYEEALLKHVYPSNVLQRGRSEITVLDTGFGIGYNPLALITAASEMSDPPRITIHALEFDTRYLPLMKQIKFGDNRDLIYSMIISFFEGHENNDSSFNLLPHFGDARQSLQKIHGESFDAVFHDPFSPAKNPELWTVEFFRETKKRMKDDAILTTYSSAPQIRGAMAAAGLIIGRGPSVGPKKEGTIAAKHRFSSAIGNEELKILLQDPASTPYRDPCLNLSRDEIILNRKNEKGVQKFQSEH